MSKYTTEVRWIVEELTGPGPLTVDDRIDMAAPFIFNFNFPIWDESYRLTLEHKILLHYYFREIAFETVQLWKTFLNRKLNEMMPYYNILYTSALKDTDWMQDINLTEAINRDRNENGNSSFSNEMSGKAAQESSQASEGTSANEAHGTGSSTQDTEASHLSSDLPQTTESQQLAPETYANLITKDKNGGTTTQENSGSSSNTQSGKVTSSASSDNSQTSNGQNSNVFKGTEQVWTTRKGLSGARSQAQLLMEFRQTLLNIDMMIIDDLAPLFFTLY